jgi:hypothetical protein
VLSGQRAGFTFYGKDRNEYAALPGEGAVDAINRVGQSLGLATRDGDRVGTLACGLVC